MTPAEDARRREQAYQDWLHSTETAFLECRNGGHVKPGLTDEKYTKLDVRQGVCIEEWTCPRCGRVETKLMGVKDGFLVGTSTRGHQYPEGYLLPKEACDGTAMSKERRGEVRLELMDRRFRAHGSTLAKEVAKDTRREKAAATRNAKKVTKLRVAG